jgi:hypothetical protein
LLVTTLKWTQAGVAIAATVLAALFFPGIMVVMHGLAWRWLGSRTT